MVYTLFNPREKGECMSVFQRNLTSIILEKALRDYIRTCSNVTEILEVGCGDGNITRAIASDFRGNKYFASDISKVAVDTAKNLCSFEVSQIVEFRSSAGLNAWADKKFDVILCDISAINQRIAELSDWYIGVECNTGDDGLGAIRPIIENVKDYLRPGGIFILPTISLSNTDELESLLKQVFHSVTMVEKKDWPMPKNLSKAILDNNIPDKGINWSTKNKFGIEIASTGVLLCRA